MLGDTQETLAYPILMYRKGARAWWRVQEILNCRNAETERGLLRASMEYTGATRFKGQGSGAAGGVSEIS